MDRRIFISSLLSLPLAAQASAAVPWSARFATGNFDGESYEAGLYVQLDAEWKTYWRNPGESGIPPEITVLSSDNFDAFEIDFPLPVRIDDESGEAIGYHDEVLFPLRLKPKDMAQPMTVKLQAFFGVCQQVCTPAKFESELHFVPSSAPAEDAALLNFWKARVPELGDIAKTVKVSEQFLVLDLAKAFTDVFVEGPAPLYFAKPDLVREAGKAWIAISGMKSSLAGVDLRITANDSGQGLEQRVTLV